MRCSKARHDIELKLDGELMQSSVRALELHLEHCPSCREFQARELKLQQMLDPKAQPEFPAWLHHQIMDQAARHDKRRLSYKYRLKLQTVPALLAIVMSLTFGALIGKFSYGKVNPLPDSTQAAATELEDNQQLARFGESSILDYSYISGGSNE
ncbi:MAG: zf-HC2 domain-containing protein [Candidatus Syntrophosphaera sp.]|nr:zf-HC2 domain-containing protein [Candidatus Syntrophosphaera sp.]